ncbi:hypothetical protein TNCV_4613391 [Trichonephila clavipes]|nr:hypothetical protein TNCV_4613391 [Trichonephila clavipes]
MDDNATCHRTLAVQDCLDSEGIQRLVWPARSPDLNPIENVWDALGRQVAGRNYPPTNKNTLIRALTDTPSRSHFPWYISGLPSTFDTVLCPARFPELPPFEHVYLKVVHYLGLPQNVSDLE